MSSFASSSGHPRKSPFQHCVPFIVATALGVELLVIVALITFYDSSSDSGNFFYVATVSYFILSTIYFAWHSLVKENTFELLAFSLISTILNSIAIYLAFRHNVIDSIRYASMSFFVLVQITYYLLCYISYKHFKVTMMQELQQSVHVRTLMAIRTFEMFISMIKVDFMLYVVVFATYMFYVSNEWSEFYIGGVVIGSVFGAALVLHSIMGIYAVRTI